MRNRVKTAKVRPELTRDGVAIPLTDSNNNTIYYSGNSKLRCGWIKDLFVVRLGNVWMSASSIDFDFTQND